LAHSTCARIYGDTNSIFLENASTDKVEWLIKTVKEKLRLGLAVEKRYPVCVLSKAKKAYFGILPDGTPDLKGLTAIKSNTRANSSKCGARYQEFERKKG
jgi:DNA polymerase elongation subunit (family B)